MHYKNIDINDIKFSNIMQKNHITYYKIYYKKNNTNLIINTNWLKFFSQEETQEEDIIIKLQINDSKFVDFIKNVNQKIINHSINIKNKLFKDIDDEETIHNLFFSNMEIIDDQYFLNIKGYKDYSSIDLNDTINIKLLGVWVYKDMFGITFEYCN